jgi:hypothetical protein
VLLVVLWVRSNERWERLYLGFTKSIGVNFQSGNGQLKFVWTNWSDEPSVQLKTWSYYIDPRIDNPTAYHAGFHILTHDKNQTHIGAPHWFVILVGIFITAV